MDDSFDELEPYESYERAFDPLYNDRRMRRTRRPRKQRPDKTAEIASVAGEAGLETVFETTYTPSEHETLWLQDSLREFYTQGLITDVEALVKGGKEANVYRCAAHPATGETWLAVKVYRPRMFRNLRNDHIYRQGRTTLLPSGRPVKASDTRLHKAMAGKTAYGRQLAHVSWLMHEYTTLQQLYEAGGDVPRPLAAAENAILMAYIGDDRGAAPALNEITLDAQEARSLFAAVLRNIELMLAHGRVHGDLSAYNLLYWQGALTLIDFPQVVNSRVDERTGHPYGSKVNPHARAILGRDLARVCDYFSRCGLKAGATQLLDRLWPRYARPDEQDRLADASRWQSDEA